MSCFWLESLIVGTVSFKLMRYMFWYEIPLLQDFHAMQDLPMTPFVWVRFIHELYP